MALLLCCFLAYFLAFSPSRFLAFLLTYLLTCLLSCFLAFSLSYLPTLFLSCLSAFLLTCFLTFDLSSKSPPPSDWAGQCRVALGKEGKDKEGKGGFECVVRIASWCVVVGAV